MDGIVPIVFLLISAGELVVGVALLFATAALSIKQPERRGKAHTVAGWCLAGAVTVLLVCAAFFKTIVGYSPLPYVALGLTVWSAVVVVLLRPRQANAI